MAGEKFVKYKNGKFSTDPNGGGGGGSSTFSGLDDVEFTNLQDGQVPKYNSSTQKWENANGGGGSGTVTDVKVNGSSVVDPQTGEANVSVPVTGVQVNGENVVDNKIAKIKSYKEVTRAEYEALPSTKTSDGILYAIKDDNPDASRSFPPLIYSDEERQIGVWRDGKPLYQKTIYVGSLTRGSSYTNVEHHISNIDKIISTVGMVHYTEGGEWANIPNPVGASSRLAVYSTTQYIRYYNDNVTYTDNAYFTLQYTKTTDTAGAGMWTTQGALAHHYSTTEHIIGTWIDGKPLYEKVINYGNNVMVGYDNQVHTELLHGISNIGVVVNLFVICTGLNVFNDSLLTNSDGTITCKFRVDSTRIYASGGSNHYGATEDRYWYFIIRYTKTTD